MGAIYHSGASNSTWFIRHTDKASNRVSLTLAYSGLVRVRWECRKRHLHRQFDHGGAIRQYIYPVTEVGRASSTSWVMKSMVDLRWLNTSINQDCMRLLVRASSEAKGSSSRVPGWRRGRGTQQSGPLPHTPGQLTGIIVFKSRQPKGIKLLHNLTTGLLPGDPSGPGEDLRCPAGSARAAAGPSAAYSSPDR